MHHSNFTKRFALFFVILLLCKTNLFAQQRWSAGPRVGVNFSNFWGDADNFRYKPGFAAGGFLMYSSLNHFGLSIDALYSQRGAKYKNTGLEFTQHVDYLEIPIVARYFLNRSGNFRPNLFVGPSIGIKLGAHETNSKTNGVETPQYNINNSSLFKKADLGVTAGFQLNFKAGYRQHFLIDGRYSLGLSEVRAQRDLYGIQRDALRNSTFTLALGYSFGIGKEYRSRR